MRETIPEFKLSLSKLTSLENTKPTKPESSGSISRNKGTNSSTNYPPPLLSAAQSALSGYFLLQLAKSTSHQPTKACGKTL